MLHLELDFVRAGYGPTEVLHGISLEVNPGEVVAILGPNGAGKTTLLNTISGLVRLRSGKILLDGQAVSGWPPHKLVQAGVVQVPEGRRLFAQLTVEENLQVGGYVSRDKAAQSSVHDLIFRLFPILAERRTQYAGTLSGGEQQMLAIGRGLCARPRLLMLDEPSMGLAPIVVSRIYESLPAIVSSGPAVLLVEQNARKALQVCTRGYVLSQGDIAMSDTSEALQQSSRLQQLYLGGSVDAS